MYEIFHIITSTFTPHGLPRTTDFFKINEVTCNEFTYSGKTTVWNYDTKHKANTWKLKWFVLIVGICHQLQRHNAGKYLFSKMYLRHGWL